MGTVSKKGDRGILSFTDSASDERGEDAFWLQEDGGELLENGT